MIRISLHFVFMYMCLLACTVECLLTVTPEIRPEPVLWLVIMATISDLIYMTGIIWCPYYGQNILVPKVTVIHALYCLVIRLPNCAILSVSLSASVAVSRVSPDHPPCLCIYLHISVPIPCTRFLLLVPSQLQLSWWLKASMGYIIW